MAALLLILGSYGVTVAGPPESIETQPPAVRPVATLSHKGGVRTLSWSPDGTQLVTVDAKGTLAIWDIARRKIVFALTGKEGEIGAIGATFAPSGTSLVFSEWTYPECAIKRLNLATQRAKATKLQTALFTRPVGHADDGRILLTVGIHIANYDCEDVVVWDLLRQKSIFGLKRASFCATITPAGNEIAVADRPFRVDFSTGKEIPLENRKGSVEVWNVQSGKQVAVLNQNQEVNCLAYAPNGKWLASGGDRGAVKIWDTERWKEVLTLRGQREHQLVGLEPRWALACGRLQRWNR